MRMQKYSFLPKFKNYLTVLPLLFCLTPRTIGIRSPVNNPFLGLIAGNYALALDGFSTDVGRIYNQRLPPHFHATSRGLVVWSNRLPKVSLPRSRYDTDHSTNPLLVAFGAGR